MDPKRATPPRPTQHIVPRIRGFYKQMSVTLRFELRATCSHTKINLFLLASPPPEEIRKNRGIFYIFMRLIAGRSPFSQTHLGWRAIRGVMLPAARKLIVKFKCGDCNVRSVFFNILRTLLFWIPFVFVASGWLRKMVDTKCFKSRTTRMTRI